MTTQTDTAPLSARLTLDGAIAHAEEVAKACSPCAAEHRLLAEWLRDYSTLSARVAELEGALTTAQDAATATLMTLTDEQVIAQAVADYGSAEAAVKATHDTKVRIMKTVADHWKARAAKAEDESARRNELLMEALNELASTRGERNAAEARATQAEAERDALRTALIRGINEGTDGGAAPDVSAEFLCLAPDEFAAVKRQRDEALAALSASQAREAGMREALEPFADLGRDAPGPDRLLVRLAGHAVTWSDFRKAAEAMEDALMEGTDCCVAAIACEIVRVDVHNHPSGEADHDYRRDPANNPFGM